MSELPALSHVSLGTNDYPRAKAFYDAVLATLQLKCLMEVDGGAGYGKQFPAFWIGPPHDGQPAHPGNGVHICFNANSEEEVRAFHAKALQMGGQDDGAPGLRPYAEGYYAAFVRDPDGNKVEALYWARK